MNNKYRHLVMERRNSKRYTVGEGFYAALRSDFQLLGQIENICSDGLCFRYLSDDNTVQKDNAGELIIFSYNQGFYIDNIKCRIIRDTSGRNDEPSFIDLEMKSMAVAFNEMDHETREEINELIFRFATDDSIGSSFDKSGATFNVNHILNTGSM